MKVIVVGGYPGSGKSTIMRRVIEELEQQGYVFKNNRKGLVSWMESKEIILLGSYAKDELFPGTDRFPLNVQPEACKFLREVRAMEPILGKERVIVLEGDRLFNDKMLGFLKESGYNVILCIVFMAKHLLDVRREQRSEQNASWRKGRETKVDRLSMTHPVHHHLQNNTKEDLEACVVELVQEINGKWKSEPVNSKIKDFWR